MNACERIPEGIQVTMETFERMIAADERRRCELVEEVSVLAKRHDALAVEQDPSWMVESFLEPRLKELRTVVNRLQLIRGRLKKLQSDWGFHPVSFACYEAGVPASPIFCFTA